MSGPCGSGGKKTWMGECLKRGLITRKYSPFWINQIQIKRPLFAVEKRMNYHTLYGKLFQGLHIAESIFERHLREKKTCPGSDSRSKIVTSCFMPQQLSPTPVASYPPWTTMAIFVNSTQTLFSAIFKEQSSLHSSRSCWRIWVVIKSRASLCYH